MGTRVEFYEEGADGYIAVISDCGATPGIGDLVNILKKTYQVFVITWCIDHAGELHSELLANITVRSWKGRVEKRSDSPD